MKLGLTAAVFILAAVLSACSSGTRRPDTYTSSSGAVTVIESDRESCERSCNADYSRCAESDAARRDVGGNVHSGIFGADASCREALKSCLPRCKGR